MNFSVSVSELHGTLWNYMELYVWGVGWGKFRNFMGLNNGSDYGTEQLCIKVYDVEVVIV